VTPEFQELIENTIAFVRLRRTSRRATAAEARAALELEELLVWEQRRRGEPGFAVDDVAVGQEGRR
jgi:hypothetical protein